MRAVFSSFANEWALESLEGEATDTTGKGESGMFKPTEAAQTHADEITWNPATGGFPRLDIT